MAHLRWLIKVSPEIDFWASACHAKKWPLKLLSKIPPCVWRPIRQRGNEVFHFKCRGGKSQTQETDQRKKKKTKIEKTEAGGEKGQTKEPTRRLQENWQALLKPVGLRMKRTQFWRQVKLQKVYVTVGQNSWSSELVMGTSHSARRNRNVFGRMRGSEREMLPGHWEGRHTRGEARRKRYWTN